jgi:hypothetical protein
VAFSFAHTDGNNDDAMGKTWESVDFFHAIFLEMPNILRFLTFSG